MIYIILFTWVNLYSLKMLIYYKRGLLSIILLFKELKKAGFTRKLSLRNYLIFSLFEF